MMKSFSFLTILESLSKKLSILRTKMHSDDLRVNHGTITRLLRVSRPFSHCASSGSSFALSRRVSHFAAILTILFTVGVGNMWGASWVRLDSIDFMNTTNFPAATYVNSSADVKETVNDVFFWAKKGSKAIKVNDGVVGVDFQGQNIQNNGQHGIAIPVTGVNGSLKVIVYHDYNNTSAKFKVGISHADGNDPSKSQTWDQSLSDGGTKNKNDYVLTKSSLGGTDYIVWVGEASSSYKGIKRVAIYTEVPCAAANLTASNITSNGNQEAGTGITFSIVGTPASGDTWYWQTSATGTDKTYNATSPYTTATTAGSYTVYLRAFNTDCWGEAASMTNTIYPAPSAMIHNTFAVNAAWGSTIATQDKANITNLNAMAAVGQSVGTGSDKDGLTQKIPSQSSEDPDQYMSLSFNVAAGKQLNVTSVVFDEQPVTGTGTFKVSISDNQGSATKTQTIASGSAGAPHTLTLDGDIVGSFKGTVTVKVWAYGWSDGYRFGNYFYVNGTVEEAETPVTTTITLSSQGGTSGTASVTATKGEAMPEIDIPTRTGYNFQGYFTANGGTGTKYYNADGTSAQNWDKEDATFTLIAYWTAKTTNVTLNANGGSGGSTSVTATYGSAMTTITPATRAGYALTGYFDAISGGTKYYNANGTSAKNWDKEAATATLYAQWECTAPTDVKISGEYVHFPGETLTLTVSGNNLANNATYTWKKSGQVIAGQTTATLKINETTIENAGNYTCTISNGGSCEATADFTIKMYSLRGLINWSTDCSFTKVNATTATYSMELAGSSSYEFKIFDGSVYYGNEGANPTMTSTNCTDWTMKENSGNNVTLQTTASGTYTFTLDYSDASNLKISVTYPAKRIVYLNPNIWASDNPKFAVHVWHGSTVEDILMTKIDDCNNRNIYFAEIDAAHTHVIFIRGNKDSYNISNPWDYVWNQTVDLQLIAQDLFTVNGWGDGKSNGEWTSFTPNYTVTFDANGHGTAPEAQCVAKDAKATTPTEPTETGYTFGGWYTDQACTTAFNFSTAINNDITLYAKWTVNTYQITYKEEDRTTTIEGLEPTTYTYGVGVAELPTPSEKIGYTFDSWYSEYCIFEDEEGANNPGHGWVDDCKRTSIATTDYGNVTFLAKYIPNTYTVTLNTNEGTINAGEINSYTFGVGATLPTDVTKENYTFLGWFDNEGLTGTAVTTIPTNATGDKTYWAKWENNVVTPDPILYTITFDTDGGSAVGAMTQTSEGAAITLPTPTRDGYTFAGWYIGGTLVTTNTYTPTADITATAAWKAECTATGGGSEDAVTLAADGINKFKTWENGSFSVKFNVESDAQKEYVKVKVEENFVFSTTGNETLTSVIITLRDNTKITITAPSTSSNTGYFTASTTDNKITVTAAKECYVTSTELSYTSSSSGSGECYYVTYNGNGATSGYVNDPTAYNSTNNTVTVKENAFTAPVGMQFAGWNTAADGTGTSYAAGATFTINSDTELFAQWTSSTPAQTYTITYNCDGATSGCPENTQATNLPNPLLSNITKTNFVFEGWYTDEAKTIPAVAGAALTGNTTLYAKWADMDIINEDVCWNISDDAFKGLGTITTRTEVNNLHIVGASNENITVDAGNKTIAGTSFTHRLKYGGKGNPFARHLWFSVMGNCNITIYMMSANNTQTRHLDIATGTFDNVVQTFDASPTPSKNTYNYTGGPTTIYLYPNDNGLNIYQICVKYVLPSCTTPVLSDLENKKVCPGSDVTWTANNTAELADGETIAYQWNKKGNNTVLSNSATLTLDDVTEAAGGTYVVTATVSADGKASATATKEVTLTVTPATATPAITASASTVYAGNPVTLKATCVSSGVTYQWYTCNDAEGNGESAIDNAKNAEYTPSTATAGTYYYKVIVTGDDTNSCGTAEKVYTLVVSNSGETTCGEIKGQFTTGAYTFDTDFIIYGINSGGNLDEGASSSQGTICGGSGNYFGKQRFVVTFPVDVLSFSFIGYQSNLRTVKAVKTTTDLKTADTEYTTITHTAEVSQEGNCQTHVITPETAIPANTFVWVELSNGLNISEICYVPVSTADCTDPQVTATVDNATVCEGTKNVTFTATNYADGATFQWQKKNGNTWTNINGATSATYTIPSVTTDHAGQYHVIAEAGCKRMSEEIKLTVLTAPTFNTFATTASVMKGNALAISDVQATGATGYAWYKSSDNSLDAAEDTKVGTSKDLLLAAASIPEAADQTFYLFCVASNSCGSITSNAITVTVTPFVEEECATKGNEGDREFGFENKGCGQDTYGDSKTPVWKTSSRSKYLTYTAPEGRYFATAKVTVAHSDKTKCGYAYSTDGGATWKFAELDGLSATLTQKTIDLSELSETVNAFRISRNLQDGNEKDWGVTTGTFYLAEICFTYTTMCTETTLTAGSYNNEYNISTQMDFVEPTFTLKAGETTLEGQTLTYTSSNTAIATVDEDGNVTFEGMTGTVTITATFAGGEISETEYCACQGSYTITVGCKDQAPKIVAAAGTNLNGCNNSITLEAKMQDGTTAFVDGTFQWYRDGEAIDGATSASYIVVRAGTYTVSRTYTCTTMSSNSAVVTNEKVEPEVERLTPFQYYHVDKTYSNQMKNRHLFAVTSYGTLNGKRYHLTATRNGETLDLSSSTAFFTIPSSDNAVDTVMIDLNELKGKYSANDEIVITCAPINSCHNASAITASITIHVIDQTPTLALICSGANGDGTRDTKELVVGGDFLTGYNKADLCQQTGNKTFDANTEWGFYTELKEKYIVTPVNGYAEFNKLNYEPFDILLLTDYPKASKSEAAATILDDMAALCDYRPLLSLKAHMVAKSPSKWAAKGFTTSPVVPATTSQYANIVCYAHPMFDDLDDAHVEGIYHDHDDFNQLVYKILTGPGHESGKGLQGFELKDADNFVTIGLIHYNAAAAVVEHDNHTHLEWTPAADDRQLVAIAERQANIEARMILFAINCGAQSMQTPMGRQVLLTCLDYLLKTDLIEVADCRLTFDNGEGNINFDPNNYEGSGEKGDGLWSTAANWGPEYTVVPGRNNDVRIAAPCTVDANEVEVLSVHITENGSLTIPADKSLTARSTILRADEDGNVYPTNVEDISLGSNAGGNASLILNNERGDTKAGVAMYSTAKADTEGYSAAASTWQYIGTPHSDVQNAAKNYYDSWLYQYDTGTQGWAVIPNGGPLVPFRGYCVTHPEQGHTYWMEGTLVSTTNQDITIPAGKFVVVANSWTAPIQIGSLEDDDLEGLTDKTIYFFNTGSDPNQAGELNKENGRYAAGTYVSVPIHSAPYTGDSYIPSMQGFYVVGGGADGTLHLDYERHVRAPRTNTPSGPMHAPARRVAADNEPQVAKFLFRGTRYDDRLIILERPDFTRGYDSGWDGEQWGGNAAAPMSYVVTETRWDAVSAIPEYEGTVIAFRAGEDSEYTIHFDYDGMEDALYLLDTDTQIYTRVLKGNSYTFTCADKAEHNRFILTRKAPQIATGTDHVNTGENAKAVKFIKDDKIFIFVNGTLYDATGKMVIR